MKQSPAAAAFSEVLAARRAKSTDWVGIVALTFSLVVVGAAAVLGLAWHVDREAEGIMAGLAIALATWLGLHAAKNWDDPDRRVGPCQRASVAFEQLVEHLPLVVYVDDRHDTLGEPLHEPAGRAVARLPAEQWMSDPDLFVKVLHPDDRERVLELVRETNETRHRVLERVPDGPSRRAHGLGARRVHPRAPGGRSRGVRAGILARHHATA